MFTPPAATMQDIADRVGVHRTTVSNVLNGRLASTRRDAAERAAEIRRVAEELNYRPSLAARAIRTGRTGFIGMIHSRQMQCSNHAPEFNAGLDDALHDRGLCLVRDIIDDGLVRGDCGVAPPRIVREDAVDGLLVNYAYGTPPAVRDVLDRCGVPAIWINRRRDANCVRPDDEGAARVATRYLLEHGHTRIAMLTLDNSMQLLSEKEVHYSLTDRWSGYHDVMQEAGLAPRAEVLDPPVRLTYQPGRVPRDCIAFLERPGRPTAVLCDRVRGRVLLAAAWKLGIRVPEELSIIGFEDTAQIDADLACDRVLVPHRPMGRAAVHELVQLIDDPAAQRPPVVLPFEFHRVGSVCRPPAA